VAESKSRPLGGRPGALLGSELTGLYLSSIRRDSKLAVGGTVIKNLFFVFLFSPFVCAARPIHPTPSTRTAKVHAVVFQNKFDGHTWSKSRLCSVDFTVRVFVFEGGGTADLGAGADCFGMVKDTPVRVNINGSMNVENISLQPEDGPHQLKSAKLFLATYSNTDGSEVLPTVSGYAAVRELNIQWLVVRAGHEDIAGPLDETDNFEVTSEFHDGQ
jgi:hypothetical protein